MARNGRRHSLVLYTKSINRLWITLLWIGVLMLGLAAGMEIMPFRLPQNRFVWVSERVLWVVAGAGVYAVLLAIFLATIRKYAYVQPFANHLRLITPFLRMHISYRRIIQASSVEMQHLFPIGRYKGWREKLMRPLAGQTAIVLELRGWPLPRWVLQIFLSPFFFPDNSSRLALLVPNWMEFSNELEGFRVNWVDSQTPQVSSPQNILLKSISRTRR